MKLCRLDLIAFGPFEGTSLDFRDGDLGLHVVYGDNEDGKSTTLRATHSLLYGVPERTQDAHKFEGSQLRIGGLLRRADGEELAFVRKKARKDALRHPESDDPLTNGVLAPFLGGVSDGLFATLYGIDHPRLVAGGKAILEQTGDLGKTLYAAATGTRSLRTVLEDLESRADELFKARARKTKISETIADYKTQVTEAKSATFSSSAWTKLERERNRVTRELSELEAERKQAGRGLTQYQRIRRVRPALVQRQELLGSIEELGDVILLAEDFEDNRREATELRRKSEEQLERASGKIERLEREEEEFPVATPLLQQAAAIEVLNRKLGSYQDAVADRPGQDAKRRQYRNDARVLLKAIRPGLDLDEADSMRPLLASKRTVRELGGRHQTLTVEEQNTQTVLREAREQCDGLEEELNGLREVPDTSRLSATMTSAQRAGDLDQQIEDMTVRLGQKREQCTVELARLGLWKGSLAELERLSLPTAETLEGFEKRFHDGTDKKNTIQRQLGEIEARRSELTEQLATLSGSGSVPTVDELDDARSHRDSGWGLVRRKCFDGADMDAEITEFAGDGLLPDVYEAAVSAADQVADQLRHDADRVQQREILEAELKKESQRLSSTQSAADRHGETIGALDEEWMQLWASTAIQPRSPREMLAWLRRAETLQQQMDQVRGLEADVDRLTKNRGGHRTALAAEIRALQVKDVTDDVSLGALLDRSASVVEQARASADRRRGLEAELKNAKAAVARAEEEKKGVRKRREIWEQEWKDTVAGFDFVPDTTVSKVLVLLDQLEELFDKIDRADDAKRRLYGIDKRIEDYETDVDVFASKLDQPRDGQPAEQYVVQLHEGLALAREAETSLKNLRQQRDELKTEELDLRAALSSLDKRFAELREQAQVDSDDQLIDAGQRSARARDLQSRLEQLDQQILNVGDGFSIEELSEQANGVDGEELETEIEELKRALQSTDEEWGNLQQRVGELNQEINAISGEATAAEAQEQAEQALSQLRQDVPTYLRLRAAALILNNQIEKYRKDNQAPVLRRASELFARLTLGSYKGLEDEVDNKGNPILLGVRPDDQVVTVDGMSDGTRDQLYLALRLATLEQHLQHGEPMPFVVDDILVGFDDDRTKACLQVLAELANSTQVLVFTHHRRVAEIAHSLGDGIFVHELPKRPVI